MSPSLPTFTSAAEYLLVREQLLSETRKIDDAHAIGIIFMMESAFASHPQIIKIETSPNACSNGPRVEFEAVLQIHEDFQAKASALAGTLRALYRKGLADFEPAQKIIIEARFQLVNYASDAFKKISDDFVNLAPMNLNNVFNGISHSSSIPRGNAVEIANALGLPRIAAKIESQRLASVAMAEDYSEDLSKAPRL